MVAVHASKITTVLSRRRRSPKSRGGSTSRRPGRRGSEHCTHWGVVHSAHKTASQHCIPYPSILQPATRALATMAGLSTGAGAPVVKVYHEKSMILPDVSRVLACLANKKGCSENIHPNPMIEFGLHPVHLPLMLPVLESM